MPRTITRKEHGRYRNVFFNADRGRWEQRVSFDGRRLLFSAKTAAEVATKVAEAHRRAAQGLTPTDASTVAQFLEWWLTESLPQTVKASTVENYRNVLEFYVIPHLGSRPLGKLAPADVTVMLNKLERGDPSATPPRRPVAPNTRRAARSVLRRALRKAEQEGIVTRNAAAIADGVRVPTTEGRTLTPEQARMFLATLADERLSAAFAVMLALGLRRGETLGLVWDDIRLDTKKPTLTVNWTLKRLKGSGLMLDDPKTRLSRRTLFLPIQLVDEFRAHRRRQAAEQLAAGPEWISRPLDEDLVFRTPFGAAVDPDNFKNRTYALTAAAGVEFDDDGDLIEGSGIGRWSPHELRHSAASILLAMGVPLEVVSETLGHSSIRITKDVYGHLLEPARQEAADAAGRALWA